LCLFDQDSGGNQPGRDVSGQYQVVQLEKETEAEQHD
jgi:hypothetical protein